jgi:hypothetical protein
MSNFLALSLNSMITEEQLIVPTFFTSVVVEVVTFILMALGIYTMAKRQNLNKKWLAFIPFFNFILLGRVLGSAIVWGKKIKNVGLWVTITSLISTVFNLFLNYGYYLVIIQKIFNVTVYFDTNSFWYLLATGKGVVYNVLSIVSFVPDLAYIFFEVSLIFMVFRMYAPERSLLYSLASVFIEPFFGILLFMVRNRKRHSRDEFIQHRTYTYNPFNNPYGGFENNRNNQQNQPNQKSVEDPFPEFSDKNASSKSDGDDLFS